MRMRIFATVSLVISALSLGYTVVNANQPHKLSAAYTRVIETGVGATAWKDAEKGDLSGTLKFSAKRPNQSVVVYLVADDGEGEFAAPAAEKFKQKGAKFEPAFAVLVRGQKAEFVNDEGAEIDHNVYFLGAEEVDLGIFQPGAKAEHEFGKAGEVSVHCSIHKLMDAKLFVAPSPAFAEVAGDATTFEIRGVPVGKYTLKTYQKSKRFKDAEVKVEIKKGETTKLDVEMTR
jgi:plastocyanin